MIKSMLLVASVAASSTVYAAVPSTLDSVFAPVKVATGPSDAYIRTLAYARWRATPLQLWRAGRCRILYLSSTDGGLTWRKVKAARDMPQADIAKPTLGRIYPVGQHGSRRCVLHPHQRGPSGDRTVTKVSDMASIADQTAGICPGWQAHSCGRSRRCRSQGLLYSMCRPTTDSHGPAQHR